jgi:hypothetical protein
MMLGIIDPPAAAFSFYEQYKAVYPHLGLAGYGGILSQGRHAVLIGAVFSILFAILVKILLYNHAPLNNEMLLPMVFSLVPCFIATPFCWLIVRPLQRIGGGAF